MYPFYFGTTNLECMNRLNAKGKRSAPYRWVHQITHRYLYYRGKYFEYFTNSRGYVNNYPTRGSQCNAETEYFSAGYGVLSLECMKKCARSYTRKYGYFSSLSNNCHHFANKMAEILCDYNSCPSWCL